MKPLEILMTIADEYIDDLVTSGDTDYQMDSIYTHHHTRLHKNNSWFYKLFSQLNKLIDEKDPSWKLLGDQFGVRYYAGYTLHREECYLSIYSRADDSVSEEYENSNLSIIWYDPRIQHRAVKISVNADTEFLNLRFNDNDDIHYFRMIESIITPSIIKNSHKGDVRPTKKGTYSGYTNGFIINFSNVDLEIYTDTINDTGFDKALEIRRVAYDSDGNIMPDCSSLWWKNPTDRHEMGVFWRVLGMMGVTE